MYDDDVDLIEQVSDDEDDDDEDEEAMETEQAAQAQQQQAQAQQQQQRPRGNRLTDQVNMDDEPTLQGYERYVSRHDSERARERE